MAIPRPYCALMVFVLLGAPGLSAQTSPARDSQEPTSITLITEADRVRFTTPGTALEWRLEIFNAQRESVFDSGVGTGTTLDWPLVDAQGQAVENGLYSYTLTIRRLGSGAQLQRGQLQIEQSRRVYRVDALNTDPSSTGIALSIIDASEPRAESAAATTTRGADGSALTRESFRRSLGAAAFAPQPLISGTGETNHMTKWLDGPSGVVGDANVTELNGAVVIGNGTFTGNLQIYGAAASDVFAGMGPDLINGPGFNYGYAGSSFGRSAGFFNVRPDASATPPNPSLRFMTANVERMIITNTGAVAIGMSSPNGRLHVLSGGSSVTIFGQATATGTAVLGISSNGTGILGSSGTSVGVYARSSSGNLVEGHNDAGRKFHIDNAGTYIAGSDFAEALPARDGEVYEPGDVLILSEKIPGAVQTTSRPYDPRVAGVYSTRPGLLGADKHGLSRVDPHDVPVAIIGIVPTKVSTENGPVQVGDLLTTSSAPGYAMKASAVSVAGVPVYPVGTILGKALEPLTDERGVIKVLVTLK